MIGRILNHRYRVTELIGTGGMAHVYKAVNIGTRKTVAIKVLKEEYKDNPEFLRRFEREARAVLHLSHDNIVRAYGVGQEDGLPFIVLEYVEGKTLKDVIRNSGALPPKEAIDLAYQVLSALSAAHEAGIIHRDVKPQNVIITKSGKAKLTDFGIAREADASTMTYAGDMVLGSVHYLSPEQAKGKPVNEESDLYSTGVMLYEMLSGDVPFTGDNSVTIALMHISDTPAPLIEKNPAVSPALSDVVMRALEKNEADRYQSAAAMGADLLRSQYEPYGDFAKKAEKQKPESQPGKLKPGKKRRRIRINAAYLIAFAVVLAVTAIIVVFASRRKEFEADKLNMQIVPTLTARDVEEAVSKAENFGFDFEVQTYETSETVPYGFVIAQEPEPGVNAKVGTLIYGIVSLGPDAPAVPDLIGMTSDEAAAALKAEGLTLGAISYRVSDVAIGYVCMQTPAAGTETEIGVAVDICISASSSEGLSMPQLTGETFESVMELIGNNAFTSVLVRETNDPAVSDELVTSQQPLAGDVVQRESRIELTVNMTHTRPYSADVAFNVDVAESGSVALVTVRDATNGVEYERVLYEAVLEKGERVPISFTAFSDTEGTLDVILYENGQLLRHSDVSFVRREGGQ